MTDYRPLYTNGNLDPDQAWLSSPAAWAARSNRINPEALEAARRACEADAARPKGYLVHPKTGAQIGVIDALESGLLAADLDRPGHYVIDGLIYYADNIDLDYLAQRVARSAAVLPGKVQELTAFLDRLQPDSQPLVRQLLLKRLRAAFPELATAAAVEAPAGDAGGATTGATEGA